MAHAHNIIVEAVRECEELSYVSYSFRSVIMAESWDILQRLK